MAVTAEELARYGKHAIDLYLKNDPIDAVNAERPLLKKLMAGKKETTSGKNKLVVQVRKGNDSNFQDFYGSEDVTYNRKDTIEQASYDYANFHDGFSLHEDDFIRNGVVVTEGGPGKKATASEKETITNMFQEHLETLRSGFEESLDVVVHGTYGMDASSLVGNITSNPIYGLADMISITPTAGTYAGIARSNAYWQNHASTGITATASTGDILTKMRVAWRACTKYGGRPDMILCGSTFLDGYIDHMMQTYGRVNYTPISGKDIEGAEGGVFYQGVPLVWDPTFDTFGAAAALGGDTYSWAKRCYFINTKFLKLMPIKGQHMVSRTPPRVYNKYEYYWALTTRFYLVNTKPRAHAVLCLA